ncbi:acetyl-CoA hydrolase/transferase family protein [Anaerophilus nitritogenes]|uniref:acetyl-CoA hydrolase/transferase family protein n=1 Tax=Anaerophilus nitritogenes TaxID=2498136 RepID=UPI00101B5E12|nr:acetyl-CoA hydrolase/transferase C-terminal domain-containing protein [Anaerophilus nitritogenes]
MDWKKIYKSKLTKLEDAVKKIKSRDRVVTGHAAAEPQKLIDAMIRNKDQYEDVEIVHMVPLGKGEYTHPEMAPHFRHNALFVGGSTRQGVAEARADYTPCFFTEIPRLFKEGYLPVDVALIQLSRPDEHGYCSFGVSNDYTKPATECAKLVIAEVNDHMPRTMGDSFIHVSDLDCIIETSYPIIELNPPKIGDVEKAIGENCATLINDGDTLQLGIGAIPDAVLLFLKDKKDLGIHSEMFSDGVVELVESGVVNNKRKTLHKDKMIVTFLMGTQRLYDFVNNNPSVEMYSVDYVNNPYVIMQNENMVSINSCIQVDLMGQVVSDTIGLKQFSGVGGQIDYVRGASLSKGGKSIIAIPSTASKGKLSRIVPFIDEGAAVTTSRNDVHYIVTEYGIANLRGKTLKERGRALIQIAHPDFKPMLIEEWERRFCTKFE